jgi:peptide deformylase
MHETMKASSGVGLAAPQIGLALNMFVVDLSPYADDDPALADSKRTFINPEIYWEDETEVAMEEGCLSIPGLNEDVFRPERVRIRWVDERFVPHDAEFGGYEARVIQHEYDHLRGKMFVDRLSPLRRTMLRNRLVAMSKGKYEAAYKTKMGK